MSYSVSQVARYLGVSGNTIRNRGGRFERFLSDGANPPEGQEREYTDGDVAILETVEALSQQRLTYDEIEARLDEGERLELPERPPAPEPDTGTKGSQAEGQAPESALVTESFAAALQAYDSQVARLQDRIEELEEARLEAEKRATAAETELRIARERQARESAEKDDSVAWWAFWRR